VVLEKAYVWVSETKQRLKIMCVVVINEGPGHVDERMV